MRRFIWRSAKRAGLPPGSLEYVGESREEPVAIKVVHYDPDGIEERQVATGEECVPLAERPGVTWIRVSGVHESEPVQRLGSCFDIHPLVLEDVVNTTHRPKLEDLDRYLFVILKVLRLDEKTFELHSEQVSLIVQDGCVISFQETPEDVFTPVLERIRSGRGRIRGLGADYLAYALLDAVVDGYLIVLEQLATRIDKLEQDLVENPSPETLQHIHALKRDLVFLRRAVWPLRELVSNLTRKESPLVSESILPYIRDVHDHVVTVIDITESLRDLLMGMHDTYLSSVSNRMNEVMRVLTIIATVFIPLTFIAGIYGMNFQYMPELGWHWSYPAVWVTMLVVAVGMVFYFRKKRWL